jgi:hypothetical protein
VEEAGFAVALDKGEDGALAGGADVAALGGRREVLVAGTAHGDLP